MLVQQELNIRNVDGAFTPCERAPGSKKESVTLMAARSKRSMHYAMLVSFKSTNGTKIVYANCIKNLLDLNNYPLKVYHIHELKFHTMC